MELQSHICSTITDDIFRVKIKFSIFRVYIDRYIYIKGLIQREYNYFRIPTNREFYIRGDIVVSVQDYTQNIICDICILHSTFGSDETLVYFISLLYIIYSIILTYLLFIFNVHKIQYTLCVYLHILGYIYI